MTSVDIIFNNQGLVAESVDALDSKSGSHYVSGGSSPPRPTKIEFYADIRYNVALLPKKC